VKVTLNGATTAEIKDDPSRPAGQLAMQMHAGNEMLVYFKDIEVLGEPKKGEDKKAASEPTKIEANKDGSLVLPARHCTITGKNLAFMPEWEALGFWRDSDHASWEVDVPKAGTYDVFIEWSVDEKNAGNPFVVEAGQRRLESKVPSSKKWNTFRRERIGQIALDAGPQRVALRPNGKFTTALMDLRELRLIPHK
jgi:peptidoglycan-N-acetylglucosamine deacetylase